MSLVISYPGSAGSFSHKAALAFFGGGNEFQGFGSWEDAARSVLQERADYGVFPIENSSAGIVAITYEFLEKYPLSIVGERRLKVEHHLMGLPGADLRDIREVRSHPQAIAQCHGFLAAHPEYRIVPSPNTALSARFVKEKGDPALAAIASREAAGEYGLKILQENIHASDTNTTRFVALSRREAPLERPNKATAVFTVENHVGALAQVLLCFARHGLNMSRIESRPVQDRPFEYFFCADFEGDMDESHFHKAMAECRAHAGKIRLAGMYRKAGETV